MQSKKRKTRSGRTVKAGAGTDAKKRQRLDPALRRSRILDAAAKLIAAQGYLPIHMGDLAREFSGSKALVYAYFPAPGDLYNAVLEREIIELRTRGLGAAFELTDVRQTVEVGGLLYFDYVMERGPLLRVLICDRLMQDCIEPSIVDDIDAAMNSLVEQLRQQFGISRRTAAAACEMLSTIPEEAGSLALTEGMDIEALRTLCRRLLVSGLESLSALPRCGAELIDHAAGTLDDREGA